MPAKLLSHVRWKSSWAYLHCYIRIFICRQTVLPVSPNRLLRKRPQSPAYPGVVQIGRYTNVVVAVVAAADHAWRDVGWFIGNTYGTGSGPIWLDNVVCNNYQSHIDFCDHLPLGVDDCSHSKDVSVSCLTGMKLIAISQVRACAKRTVILKLSTAFWSIKIFSVKYKGPITRGHIAHCSQRHDATGCVQKLSLKQTNPLLNVECYLQLRKR